MINYMINKILMLCECTDDILTFDIYSVASNIVLLYVNNISLPPRDVATPTVSGIYISISNYEYLLKCLVITRNS